MTNIDFKQLIKIYNREKENRKLSKIEDKKLEENFYSSLINLVEEISEKLTQIEQGDKKGNKEEMEKTFEKTKRYAERIINLRRKKILQQVLSIISGSKKSSLRVEDKKMTPLEKKLSKKILETAESFNKKSIEKLNNIRKAKKEKERPEKETTPTIKISPHISAIVKEKNLSFEDSEGFSWKNVPLDTVIILPQDTATELEEKIKMIGGNDVE